MGEPSILAALAETLRDEGGIVGAKRDLHVTWDEPNGEWAVREGGVDLGHYANFEDAIEHFVSAD